MNGFIFLALWQKMINMVTILFLSFFLQTRSPERPKDNGLCVSFHLFHHLTGSGQAGQ